MAVQGRSFPIFLKVITDKFALPKGPTPSIILLILLAFPQSLFFFAIREIFGDGNCSHLSWVIPPPSQASSFSQKSPPHGETQTPDPHR